MTTALIDTVAAGDLANTIEDIDLALQRAEEAGREGVEYWESQSMEAGYGDEFSITSCQLRAMSLEWKYAYLARLVASVATLYGASVGESPAALTSDSPGSLLRAIYELACKAEGSRDE